MIGYTTTPLASIRRSYRTAGPAPDVVAPTPTLEFAKAHPFAYPRIAAFFEDEVAEMMHDALKIKARTPIVTNKQNRSGARANGKKGGAAASAMRLEEANRRRQEILTMTGLLTRRSVAEHFGIAETTAGKNLTYLCNKGLLTRSIHPDGPRGGVVYEVVKKSK